MWGRGGEEGEVVGEWRDKKMKKGEGRLKGGEGKVMGGRVTGRGRGERKGKGEGTTSDERRKDIEIK